MTTTMTTNKVSLDDLIKHSPLTYEPHTLLSIVKQLDKYNIPLNLVSQEQLESKMDKLYHELPDNDCLINSGSVLKQLETLESDDVSINTDILDIDKQDKFSDESIKRLGKYILIDNLILSPTNNNHLSTPLYFYVYFNPKTGRTILLVQAVSNLNLIGTTAYLIPDYKDIVQTLYYKSNDEFNFYIYSANVEVKTNQDVLYNGTVDVILNAFDNVPNAYAEIEDPNNNDFDFEIYSTDIDTIRSSIKKDIVDNNNSNYKSIELYSERACSRLS